MAIAKPKAGTKLQQNDTEKQRASLEQHWVQPEQGKLLQADPWTSAEVMQLVSDVQRLHSKGKGQSVPGTAVIIQRLQLFPESIQGFEGFEDNPTEVISRGSTQFGSRAGFVVLLRGPEQYLTKGSGYIYVYYVKELPNEFKVGMSRELPERRVEGRLVGRVSDQGRRNHKDYLLAESFPTPHRTLTDQVLKIRLCHLNFSQSEKGDVFTQWLRGIPLGHLRDHIRDVIRIVAALHPSD